MSSQGSLGVVCHFSTSNYGNHLVNLATRWMLEECGFEVELLVPQGQPRSAAIGHLRRAPLKVRRLGIAGAASRLTGRLGRAIRHSRTLNPDTDSSRRRRDAFRDFSDAHLRPTTFDVRERHLLIRRFARFAIGGDQIWNFDYGLTGAHFADFADPGSVLTMSPSVGHAAVPREWLGQYSRWLRTFHEVGTREVEWTESIASRRTRTRFTQLIDPTLMYDADVWRTLANTATVADGGILLYTLGELAEEQLDFVRVLSSRNRLRVLRLSESDGGALWGTNASDFLGMIRAASCVVTDSYHGAVFAYLFDKPLVMLERHGFASGMNTRIRTVSSLLGLESRYWTNLTPDTALVHDYRSGRGRLERARDDYWAYLERNGASRGSGSAEFQQDGKPR